MENLSSKIGAGVKKSKFQQNSTEAQNCLQIMTPFCIFPIDTGDKRCPLGNIAGLTFQPTLKGWKFNSLNYQVPRAWFGKRRKFIVRFKLSKSIHAYPGMTAHLRPGRRCRGLESPASRNSSCHGVGCLVVGNSSLKKAAQGCSIVRETIKDRIEITKALYYTMYR